jgi:type IV fimbrial biogenesis protein FimT
MFLKSNNSMKGFTLVEMMVTLAIGAILLTIALPSYIDMTKNNKLTSHANYLISQIHYARVEASKRSTRVILCRSADPTASSPTCGGTAYIWSTGWLVFALGDTSSRSTPYLYDSSKDTLLLVGEGRDGVIIRSNGAANNNLEINSDGSTAESGTAYFALCDDRGVDDGKEVKVMTTGRAEVISATTCAP